MAIINCKTASAHWQTPSGLYSGVSYPSEAINLLQSRVKLLLLPFVLPTHQCDLFLFLCLSLPTRIEEPLPPNPWAGDLPLLQLDSMNEYFKKYVSIGVLSCLCNFCFSQNLMLIDSLSHRLDQINQDTDRVLTLTLLSYELRNTNPYTSMLYGYETLQLAQKFHFKQGEARALYTIASTYRIQGEISKSMENILNSLKIVRDGHFSNEISRGLNLLGIMNPELKNYDKASDYLYEALAIAGIATHQDYDIYSYILELSNIGVHYKLYDNPGKNLDSARYYPGLAYDKMISSGLYNPSLSSHMGDLKFQIR